ncbi:Major facilitator superfamily domain, general substrate transporter [Penicillium occitanis (nom. inval.)]|nr:Major facilitator superfamily domain, general substrate transporter [Penicillium occitanis (nom. inval.)]PCG93768.1 hypothetical protein PENOC_085940 [Penicillium occitanis (nom. inval.)]
MADETRKTDVEEVADHAEYPCIDDTDLKRQLDVGAQALAGQDLTYTKDEARKLLRKIDWHIMPLAAWACGLQFVDKSGLGAAATYGLQKDLGLTGNEYSWCVSIFYFGYIAGTLFVGRAMQRFHTGKYIGLNFFVWGCTLLGCMAAKNYSTLLALRFLLGVFESCVVPGLSLITGMWYTQEEKPLRFGLWTVTNGAMPVPFLVIYYGLGHVTTGPVQSWHLIFLLIGLLSCVTGIVLWFFLPDSPVSVSWLNDREKAIAVKRVSDDQLGVKNETFKWEHVKDAVTDYRCWLMVLQMFFSQAAGSVTTNFLGIIIKGFGYTALKAQLFTAPNYAVQAVMQMIVSGLPTFVPALRNWKQPLACLSSCVAVAGVAILYITPPLAEYGHRRLAGCIMISFSGVNYTVIMSVISSNVGGFTKKQVVTSTAFFLYCVTNIITPQTFQGSEAPYYHTGLGFVLAFLSLYVATSMSTWLLMGVENKRREKKALTDANYATGDSNLDVLSGLRDETDVENKHFRYSG